MMAWMAERKLQWPTESKRLEHLQRMPFARLQALQLPVLLVVQEQSVALPRARESCRVEGLASSRPTCPLSLYSNNFRRAAQIVLKTCLYAMLIPTRRMTGRK